MANKARKNQKNHQRHRLSIERFAYDVFSYILPIFDFPETHALKTDTEENIYVSTDFVEKAALSVLPLAMYMRDKWKHMFEYRQSRTGFNNSKMIQDYLKKVLTRNSDFLNADIATKVRVSLALYNELILFFEYKGLRTHVEHLAKLWNGFYLEHISKNQDIGKLFQSSFLMFPEVFESGEWILTFVKKFAVPYGRLKDVSEIFSVYSILSEDSKTSLNKRLKHNAAQAHCDTLEEFVAETPIVVNQNSGSLPRESRPLLSVTPIDLKTQDYLVNTRSGENSCLERKACKQQPTPSDVSEMNSMRQQRKTSVKAIEDAFGQISLDGANSSQECQGVKPKRKKGR